MREIQQAEALNNVLAQLESISATASEPTAIRSLVACVAQLAECQLKRSHYRDKEQKVRDLLHDAGIGKDDIPRKS